MKNRKGIFTISRELMYDNPEMVMKIMGKCIILRAECIALNNTIEYHAVSDEFNEVSEGSVVTGYIWQLSDGEVKAVKND